jgi:hypothetical protein
MTSWHRSASVLATAMLLACLTRWPAFAQSSQPQAPDLRTAGSPAGAGRAAKLIVLRAPDAGEAELEKMATGLGAMKGVIRAAAHASDKCVSILADVDSPVTAARAMKYLDLAGYRVEEADDATTDRVLAAIRAAMSQGRPGCATSTADVGNANDNEPAVLTDLSGSMDALRERFNAEKDRPRIVALLSPL